MADERTPEQVEADAALEQAIRNAVEAHRPAGRPPSIITTALVLYAETWYDADGDGITAVGRHIPGHGEAPYHVLIGLTDTALTMFRNEVIQSDL